MSQRAPALLYIGSQTGTQLLHTALFTLTTVQSGTQLLHTALFTLTPVQSGTQLTK